jgi:hypothetical protein
MRGERARGGSGEIDDAGLTRTAGMALRPSMKLIVAGAVSSPCTRAQVAPLCSNFHLTPLTAQQRGLASAHSARLAFFRSRRVSAPLRPARTGDEPVRTPRRARRQAKRVLQGDGGFPQGCDARRAAIVTVPTISVPVNDRFVPWNACSPITHVLSLTMKPHP